MAGLVIPDRLILARRPNPHGFGLPTIETDMLVTRRKIFHSVCTPEGHALYAARQISACVKYLQDIAVSEYVIVLAPDKVGRQAVIHVDEKEQLQWQSLLAP